jgi:group I intron endonuclease
MPYKAIPGVYRILCLVTGRSYVGSSGNIRDRWRRHKQALNEARHHSILLQHAWRKYGALAFSFTILQVCENNAERITAEQHWIDNLHAAKRGHGYNRAPFAGTVATTLRSAATRRRIAIATTGRKASSETRAKMSASRKGRPAWNLGLSHSAATRRKMSEGQRDHRRRNPVESAETSARRSRAKKGLTKSPEHRAKIAATLTGKILTDRHRANISAGLRRYRLGRI